VSDKLKILDTNFAFIPTDKGLNYIICKEFKEVFFDIFEINCGGNKIIAEKVDDISGDPVLKLTTEYNNNLYTSLYVLKEGDDNIIFNVNSLDNGRRVFAKEKQILESVAEEENLPDPEPIVEETYITSESASVDIERYKADAIRVINENHSNKKHKIEQLSESLTNLIDERLSELKSSSITDIKGLKSDILKSFDERVSQVEIISDRAVAEANSIRESIEATAELYTNIVTTNADEKTKQLQDLREGVVYDVNTKIAELQTELVNQEAQVNNAFQSIQTFIDESKKQLLEQKTTNITDVEHICNESKQVISENLKRAESLVSNKIGKLQSTADKKINDITALVENRISLFDNRIADINSAIERAENSLQEQISQGLNNILTEAKSHSSILEDKKIEIKELVSKTANELSVLGTGIVEAVEKKVKDFNLVAIKREDLNSLKKQLETRLENESANLKKYVAGYGGGGSVAAQYANGGTMNGSLNIATGQILSGGIDIGTIFGGGSSGVSYLSALNDVSIPSPANGQVLVYSSVLEKWTTGSPASASGQTGYYGSFYDTTAQTLTGANQAKRLNIANTFEANGISLSSNKIVFNNIGTYELIFSIQYKNTSQNQEDIYIWFRKNGVDIPDSSSVFTIPARKNASIPAQLIAVTPFIATLAANDFIEIYWHCNNTAVTVETFTTHTNPTIPDTPGVIITAKQVTNVQLVPTVGAYLPLSGGTVTGVLSTTNVIYASGGNSNQWNSTYSTVQTNSASWNPAGSYLPLSGGVMTGNITRDNGSEGYNLSQSNLSIYYYNAAGSTEMGLNRYSLAFSDSQEGGGSISMVAPNFGNQNFSVTFPRANGNIMTDQSVWENTLPIGWYDAMFYRDGAANTIAQRNGASAQTFRVYNKFTSASIYERGFSKWNSNVFQVGTEKLGTGMSARALGFVTDGTERLNIGVSGAITTTNSVSTTNVMYASGGNSNQWNSSYTTVQSNSATWGGGGGGLTIFSEVSSVISPNNIVPTFGLSARSLSANVDFAIIPKGTGAFILGPVPDNTGTGGNKRGQYAVDLQISKSATAARVASGNYSFLAGLGGSSTADATTSIGQGNLVTSNYAVGLGYGNSASGIAAISLGYINNNSGTASVALGQSNTTSNNRSYAIGNSNTASGDASGAMGDTCTASAKSAFATGLQSQASRYGQKSHSAGQFAAVGDAQSVQFVVRNKTTDNTATTLFLDGASTRLTITSGRILSGTINIVGSKSDGTAVARYLRQVAIKNVAGTTSLVGSVVTLGTDEATGTSISITADDTNDALSIQVTGVTAETWRWVATVEGVELAYGV